MSRFHSYLNSAVRILSLYNGGEPFSSFLRKFFAGEKKYGSGDRRMISHLCYCTFRVSGIGENLDPAERVLAGLWFCSDRPDPLLGELKPDWNNRVHLPLELKFAELLPGRPVTDLFPLSSELSEGISPEAFACSLLVQPDLFLRVRPGQQQAVESKLRQAGISYSAVGEMALSLPNGTKLEGVLELDRDAVIQDLSSQGTANLLLEALHHTTPPRSLWDCCAASGGKSIMAYDLDPSLRLSVSDVRESILANLKKRFERAGIKDYRSQVSDLSNENGRIPFPGEQFPLILADLPCSGSGTWGRTPEQLACFRKAAIDTYAGLQQRIGKAILSSLLPGGYLVYITCSVFRQENEENVKWLISQFPLQLVTQELIKGYDRKADTMFAALLQKKL